ncbi:MAG: hypothetical protein DRJ62_05005 [Thermoprotei archaeon]|nr:MAG: hypothetical protein DRJ62_05005 [Thermoprotei archaeon]
MELSGEDSKSYEELAGDFSVLSNPVRLRLLMTVHERGSCTLKELVDEAERDESTVKRHVKELLEHGFLAKSSDKRPKYYITDKGVLAITFLRVKGEPSAMRGRLEERQVQVRVRGRGFTSALRYRLSRLTIREAVFYSFSLGCVVLGVLGLFAFNVELLYRVLWLLMWLLVAYIFKVLAK